MTADPAAMLEAATQAARAAGGELMQRLAGTLDIRWKTYQGETTVVTDADMAADRAIRDVLLARFPDHVILSEEVPHDDIHGPDVWVIDPLDGTDNYSRGQPQFCVSVAHATHGRIDVGVIFDPVRDELFAATSDGPAECNGATVRVTDRDDPAISAVAWAQATAEMAGSSRSVTRTVAPLHSAGPSEVAANSSSRTGSKITPTSMRPWVACATLTQNWGWPRE